MREAHAVLEVDPVTVRAAVSERRRHRAERRFQLDALRLILTNPYPLDNIPKVIRGDYINLSLNVDMTLSALDNGLLTGTGVSGMLRALEQSWGRDPSTMIPDVRFTPHPNMTDGGGPFVERGE